MTTLTQQLSTKLLHTLDGILDGSVETDKVDPICTISAEIMRIANYNRQLNLDKPRQITNYIEGEIE